MNDMPIKTVNGAPVYMRDVAQIRDGYQVQTNIVRINGSPSSLLTVLRHGGASTLAVVEGVKNLLPKIQATLPTSLNISQLFDQSRFVRASVEGVVREASIAAVLTAFMILLFLGSWRSTLIVCISIPLSILTSLTVLGLLGILVDDATVEIENVHRNMGMKGPVARWIYLMRDLAGPALVEGQEDGAVEFKEAVFGQVVEVKPDSITGHFRVMLPEGKYAVRSKDEEQTRTFLPGGTCSLDLSGGHVLDYQVSRESSGSGYATIKLAARGGGRHRFLLRADNLTLNSDAQELVLQPGSTGTLEWGGKINTPEESWVAVIVPDGDMAARKEVTGVAWER